MIKGEKASTKRLGPGEYSLEGTVDRVEDMPEAQVIECKRSYAQHKCPECGKASPRRKELRRRLHDVGDLVSGRPHELEVVFSQHQCRSCKRYFNVEVGDLAAPGGQYTHRVVGLAVRVVVEDGLPYRTASWQLWRDHRVFVPFATIQNWVEAGGKTRTGAGGRRVSGLGAARVLRIHRGR